ncbi:MAG TPA: hypothetical protein VHZ74_03115 [Bryobacteraceae bacterium]|nr:hypothetical protein [Bryobacteraceae bacterium]
MTDNELDEILKTWDTPEPPPSLRGRVRAGFTVARNRRPALFLSLFLSWRAGFSAGALLAAAALLLFVVQKAVPQQAPQVPWMVNSEFLRYADDGSSSVEMYATSYNVNGNETIWSRSSPGNLLKTALWQAADAVGELHKRIMMPENLRAERRARAAQSVGAITGCAALCLAVDHFSFLRAIPGAITGCISGVVLGSETILGHRADMFRERWTEHGRMTLSMAPDLGCFALRVKYETERPGGSFRLVAEKRVVKITLHQ